MKVMFFIVRDETLHRPTLMLDDDGSMRCGGKTQEFITLSEPRSE